MNVICKPNRFLDGLRSLGFLALNNRRASKFLRHRFEGTGPAWKNMPGMKITGLTLVWLLAAMFAIAACDGGGHAPMPASAVEWGYEGPGTPENWASLSEEYATCANGGRQSPVDITAYEEGDPGPISFRYGGDATAVRNDGKLIHVEYPPGNVLSVGQRTFDLKTAHLHSPSEHRIDGVSFPAELHLVHSGADGHLVAVALLFTLGAPSPAVQAILDAAPADGDAVSDGITLNADGYAPDELGYYQYDGSKTTPPCQEPVDWYVMSELKTISAEQVNSLLALSGGPNNRPVQPIASRGISFRGGP